MVSNNELVSKGNKKIITAQLSCEKFEKWSQEKANE